MLVRTIYSIGFRLILPFVFLRLLIRSFKSDKQYRKRFAERLGFVRCQSKKPIIWIHAVSMGEVKAAIPLIKQLLAVCSEYEVLVTTTTITGSKTVHENFKKQVLHVYLPFDYASAVKRFLKQIKPRIAIIMETEIWPNLIYYCHQFTIPIFLANGRLSAQSAKGYQKIKFLTSQLLSLYTAIAAQAKADAERFMAIGAPAAKVHVLGNIKFDIKQDEAMRQQAKKLKQQLNAAGSRSIIIAASTHQGEDEMILSAFRAAYELNNQLLLILVPRHPERFQKVEQLCQNQQFNIIKRTDNYAITAETMIYLGNTTGELMLLYGAADFAFVAGSLTPIGGHNVLEPAAWGIPCSVGPYVHNFQTIVTTMLQQQALIQIQDVAALRQLFIDFSKDPQSFTCYGKRAQAFLAQNRGALQKHLDLITKTLVTV